jgi:nitrite reductase/ring-hydroxylating ferredoxin subunit
MDNTTKPTCDAGSKADLDQPVASTISRRDVLKTAALGVLVSVPLLQSGACADSAWTAAGKSSAFALGVPQLVTLPGGDALFITRNSKGLTAVSAKCTHRGCELGWVAADSLLECPCHGAEFKSDGTNVHGTRRKPQESLAALQAVPVREKAGNVEVNVTGISPDVLTPGQ